MRENPPSESGMAGFFGSKTTVTGLLFDFFNRLLRSLDLHPGQV
jgi:hypothetical protein